MRISYQPAGKLTAVLRLGWVLLLAGCQPGDAAFSGNVAPLADTLKMFIADLARQALAAVLF